MRKKKRAQWVHQRSQEELQDHLQRQIGHLRRSVRSYDDGDREEAERLAGVAYILLHDGGANSRSLLRELGIRNCLRFPDSSDPELPAGQSHLGLPLCAIRVEDGEADYCAPLGEADTMPKLSFGKWWDQKVFFNAHGLALSRKNLVYALRTQDGGGHVDPQLSNEAYHWLATKADNRIRAIPGGGLQIDLHTPPPGRPLRFGHWASMRQIAWELDQALIMQGY